MTTEENKAIIHRFTEGVNTRDLSVVDELVAPDFVDHSRPFIPPGPEGLKQFFALVGNAMPDFHVILDDVLAEGDRVSVRATVRGTHQGEFMGIAPTGKQVTVSLIDFNRIENGRIAERWACQDDLGLMQQVGVVPTM